MRLEYVAPTFIYLVLVEFILLLFSECSGVIWLQIRLLAKLGLQLQLQLHG